MELHVDFETRFGEREKVRAETNFRVGAEKFAEEILECAFKVAERDIGVDVEAFKLGEDRKVGGIDFVATVGGARSDDSNRRCLAFHGPDLDAGGVGAEELAGIEVKGVLLISCRVVIRSVESVEAMELVLDFRPVGEGESHPAENRDRLVADVGQGMERAVMDGAGRKGGVDAFQRLRIQSVLEA